MQMISPRYYVASKTIRSGRTAFDHLPEQIHATPKVILKQQKDRIARLEAQIERAIQAIAEGPEEIRITRLDTTDNDPISKAQSLEAAPFNADDYPMIMSIWPDSSQVTQTKIASKLGQERSNMAHIANKSQQQPLLGM